MKRFEIQLLDPSGATLDLEAASLADACEAARAWIAEGDWDHAERTFIEEARVVEVATGEEETVEVAIDPPEPRCKGTTDAAHDWISGSVVGSGGGVRWDDRCSCCDLVRERDTWATDHATGRVVDSTRYRRDDPLDDDEFGSTWIETREDLRREVDELMGRDAAESSTDLVVEALHAGSRPRYGDDWRRFLEARDLWKIARDCEATS